MLSKITENFKYSVKLYFIGDKRKGIILSYYSPNIFPFLQSSWRN